MGAENRKKSELTSQEVAIKAYNDIRHLEQRLISMIEIKESSSGSTLSFGFIVLSSVAQGNYDRALKELECVGEGFEVYALFKTRTQRHVDHAKSLVAAIRVKHMIGKSPQINKSKQKELSDRIAEHFLELRRTIVKIEKVQKSVRAEDLSSTILFVKTVYYTITILLIFSGALYAINYLDITTDTLFNLEFPNE